MFMCILSFLLLLLLSLLLSLFVYIFLHVIVNNNGELMAFKITPGNIDDRKAVKTLSKSLKGLLFGDKGYIGKKLSEQLLEEGIKLITKVRKNMKKPILRHSI